MRERSGARSGAGSSIQLREDMRLSSGAISRDLQNNDNHQPFLSTVSYETIELGIDAYAKD